MSDEKIKSRVQFVRRCYLVLITLALFFLLISLAFISEYDTLELVLVAAFMIYVYSIIYFGLRWIKQWVPLLIQVTSTFNLLFLITGLAMPYENAIELAIGRTLDVLLISFFVYQMMFFSQKAVKIYFKSTSRTLF